MLGSAEQAKHLIGQPRPGAQHQQGVVTVGVVADVVPVRDDAPDGLRIFPDEFAGEEEGGADLASYGGMSKQTVGVLLREMVELEQQGAGKFFGEPAFELDDLLQTERDGRGLVSVLELQDVQDRPALFSTFMMWMLARLYHELPEVGDRDKPKLVFFFDEAHLLFNDAPTALIEKVEQVVRLIRSKGVGVYFCTQNPLDIPEKVLGQLGNRVQHALRAFTPRDQKAVKSVAETMRANPKLDAEKAILELSVGEALVSFLDAKGTPGITERAWVLAPGSQLGPITPEDRKQLISHSVVTGVYEKTVDRESAFEKLKQRAGGGAPVATGPAQGGATAPAGTADGGIMGSLGNILFGSTGPRGGRREGVVDAMAKSAARSVGSTIGREIIRGVLGTMFGGKR